MTTTHLMLVVYCWILSTNTILSTDDQCGGFAEEGTEYTLTCRLHDSHQGLLWQLEVGTSYVSVSSCNPLGVCTDSMPSSFRGNSEHSGQLKVLSVNRTQNIFKCAKLDQSQSQICNLQVYVKTEVPTCQDPSLVQIGTGTYLQVNCTSKRVYPKGNCTFTYQGLPSNISVETSVRNIPPVTSEGDYQMQCSWLASLSGVNPALVQVRVEVYPDLRMWIEAASTYSEWTRPVILNFPTVKLASDCPNGSSVRNGYILAGTAATCRCELSSQGYPPGYAQWFTDSGDKLGAREADGSAILMLSSGIVGSKYVCRPESVLSLSSSQVQSVSFSPQSAVAPTALTIDMSDSIPLCPNESFTVSITCKVQRDNVSPQPLFTITINNVTKIDNERGHLDVTSKYYQLSHTFRPEAGGSLRIYCKAANEIFRQRYYEFERPLIINEPPHLPPKLTAQNGQPKAGSREAYITDGSNVYLSCLVEGGYPRVSNVTIVCGGNYNTMTGNLAILNVRIPDGAKTLLCHCSASHVTGCYHMTSEVVLTLGLPGSGANDADNSSLSLGLGVGLGAVILIIIVLIIGFVIMYRRKDTPTKGTSGADYNQPDFTSGASYQYASVTPGRPDPPPSRQPDLLGQNDYDLVGSDRDSLADTTAHKYLYGGNESSTDQAPREPCLSKHDLADGYIQPL